MKKTLGVIMLSFFAAGVTAQTTVTFKPGAAVGQDANIFTTYGCTLSGESLPRESLNFGNSAIIDVGDWTFSGAGCSRGTTRGLFRFAELNTIPSNAIITNAQLKLYGVPVGGSIGNSSYPGTFLSSNESRLYRVTPGLSNNWNEQTVTWGTQPSLTSDFIAISQSTTQWNWNYTITGTQLVNMVQAMLGSGNNNGFMIKLVTEAYYRALQFASSDNVDSTLWPELTITYIICDPSFTFCSNTEDPLTYTFTANNLTQDSYQWYIDGFSPTTSSATYTFAWPGNYYACLEVTNDEGTCYKCIEVCVGYDLLYSTSTHHEEQSRSRDIPQGNYSIKGDNPLLVANQTSGFSIIPNPAKQGWNIEFNAQKEGEGLLIIYDMSGRKINEVVQNVNQGSNKLYQNAEALTPGIYFIEVTAPGISIREKVVKN